MSFTLCSLSLPLFQIKRKFKPVILGHHMLMGLQRGPEGAEKMSKSVPGSAIFMDDSVVRNNR